MCECNNTECGPPSLAPGHCAGHCQPGLQLSHPNKENLKEEETGCITKCKFKIKVDQIKILSIPLFDRKEKLVLCIHKSSISFHCYKWFLPSFIFSLITIGTIPESPITIISNTNNDGCGLRGRDDHTKDNSCKLSVL